MPILAQEVRSPLAELVDPGLPDDAECQVVDEPGEER